MENFVGPAFDIATGQNRAVVAALQGGDFVVTYTGFKDIFARIFTPEGIGAGGQITVDTDDEIVNEPDVSGLAGGGFVVAWPGERTPADGIQGNDYDPLFRIFDERGISVTSVQGAEGPDGDNEFFTRVTPYGDGFAMVWAAPDDSGGASGDIDLGITGRFFSAIGTPGANPEWINVDRANVQRDPSAATLDDGTMVFTYNTWNGDDVLVRTYGANAEPFGEERIANTTTNGN